MAIARLIPVAAFALLALPPQVALSEPLTGQCIISGGTINAPVKQDCSVNLYGVGLPKLTISRRTDKASANGKSYLTTIEFEIDAPVAPGHVMLRADTEDILDANIDPIVIGGVAGIMLRNVMKGPNVFMATIPDPNVAPSKYQMVLETKKPHPQVTFSYSFQ